MATTKFNEQFSFFLKKKFQIPELLEKVLQFRENEAKSSPNKSPSIPKLTERVNVKVFDNMKRLVSLINEFRC